jgi:hypothetical protein
MERQMSFPGRLLEAKAAVALGAALTFACSDGSSTFVPATATVFIDFTIDGATDPGACAFTGATTFDVRISTTSGLFVGDFQADCQAFGTSIDLVPDDYVASAVLLDGRGHEITTTVDTRPFRLFSGDVLTIPIDFPANSFF